MKIRDERPFTLFTPRSPFFLLACLGAACGGRDAADAPSSGGSGELYVHSYVPTAGSTTGASYDRTVTFTQPPCATPTIMMGPCSLTGCFTPSSPDAGTTPTPSPPNAGTITIDGAQMPALSLEPQPGGYTPNVVDGQLPWTTGGESVTFQWTSLPGNAAAAGGSITLATPPYIALTTDSAFAVPTTTLARSQDLTVSWTSDTAPSTADQVAVDVNSGTTQLVCIFSVSAGTGVIPTAALQLVEAGAGSFNVHSKQGKTLKGVDGTPWVLGFNVDAQARTSYGLARGPVTLE